jgi:hypothetical protein
VGNPQFDANTARVFLAVFSGDLQKRLTKALFTL